MKHIILSGARVVNIIKSQFLLLEAIGGSVLTEEEKKRLHIGHGCTMGGYEYNDYDIIERTKQRQIALAEVLKTIYQENEEKHQTRNNVTDNED